MHFRELQVWQKGKLLAVEVYRHTQQGVLARDYGLKDQLQRAAVSVPSNIVEGYVRETAKDRCHFLTIARGSIAELQTQIEIACECGMLDLPVARRLDESCEEISRMLTGLIKKLRQ